MSLDLQSGDIITKKQTKSNMSLRLFVGRQCVEEEEEEEEE
jgi:hypothetical protein